MKLLAKQKQLVAASKSVTASLLFIALHYPLVVKGQFRFESGNLRTASLSPLSDLSNSSLVWQPLRATFRPLNRASAPQPPPPPPPPPPVPAAPAVPAAPTPPPPLPLALSINGDSTFESSFERSSNFEQPGSAEVSARAATLSSTTGAPAGSTASPVVESNDDLDDEQPTRVPLNRFRPTRAPSEDEQSQPSSANSAFATASGSQQAPVLQPPLAAAPVASATSPSSSTTPSTSLNQNQTNYRITAECFECICEASTSCNPNSRCQTSDVRHTRCGLFLISYDQWLETGLSKQLVTREALARDAAADERAFYECVTGRECAERLLEIYLQRKGRDCDRDGRVDCYDLAAIHQAGAEQCAGESLLESQYWSDFNACFGFGRRR